VEKKKLFESFPTFGYLSHMGVGKEGRGGLRPHLGFENFSKKGCFLSFK